MKYMDREFRYTKIQFKWQFGKQSEMNAGGKIRSQNKWIATEKQFEVAAPILIASFLLPPPTPTHLSSFGEKERSKGNGRYLLKKRTTGTEVSDDAISIQFSVGWQDWVAEVTGEV